MNDQRISIRQKSFLQGRIYFNNGRSSVDCLIRDLSETGARLKFSDAITTPEVLELHIPNKQETHRAQVQWRRGDEIGVAFVRDEPADAALSAAAAGDLTQRVRQLENDVSTLRRLVNELRNEQRGSQREAI